MRVVEVFRQNQLFIPNLSTFQWIIFIFLNITHDINDLTGKKCFSNWWSTPMSLISLSSDVEVPGTRWGPSGYSSSCACVTCWRWWWWCFPAPIPLLLIPWWLWKYLFACFMDEGMMCCCCVPGYQPPLASVMKTVFNSRWFLNGARAVAACMQ